MADRVEENTHIFDNIGRQARRCLLSLQHFLDERFALGNIAAAADNGLLRMQAILLIGKAQQRPGVPLGKVMRAQQARAVR